MHAAGAIRGRPVVGAEIGCNAERVEKAVGPGEFPSIQVLCVGYSNRARRHTVHARTGRGDGRAQVRVAAEDDDTVLRVNCGREDVQENEHEREQFWHSRIL